MSYKLSIIDTAKGTSAHTAEYFTVSDAWYAALAELRKVSDQFARGYLHALADHSVQTTTLVLVPKVGQFSVSVHESTL